MLFSVPISSLQIWGRDEKWRYVKYNPGALVINIGETLERTWLRNDVLYSTVLALGVTLTTPKSSLAVTSVRPATVSWTLRRTS